MCMYLYEFIYVCEYLYVLVYVLVCVYMYLFVFVPIRPDAWSGTFRGTEDSN